VSVVNLSVFDHGNSHQIKLCIDAFNKQFEGEMVSKWENRLGGAQALCQHIALQ
jgi:hypothetical protein